LEKYQAEKSDFVEIEQLKKRMNNRLIYAGDLLDSSADIVRHDSKKLASMVQSIMFKKHFFEPKKLTNDPILMQFVLKDSVKMPIKYKNVNASQRIA
jgi:hypothetical protein